MLLLLFVEARRRCCCGDDDDDDDEPCWDGDVAAAASFSFPFLVGVSISKYVVH